MTAPRAVLGTVPLDPRGSLWGTSGAGRGPGAQTGPKPRRAHSSHFLKKSRYLPTSCPAVITREPKVPSPGAPRTGLHAQTQPLYRATNCEGPEPRFPLIDLESLFSRARHAWAPASHASVSLAGARDRLQSGCDAGAEAPAGANSPHAGRCPQSQREGCGAPLGPRALSAELEPGVAPFSLLPRRSSVQEAPANSAGSFQAATPW